MGMEENYYLKVSLNSDGFKVVATDQNCRSSHLDINGDVSLARIIDIARSGTSGDHAVTSAYSRKQPVRMRNTKVIAWSRYNNKYYSHPFEQGQFIISEEKDRKYRLFIEFNNGNSFLISEGDDEGMLKKTAEKIFPFICRSYKLFNSKKAKGRTDIRWRIGKNFLRTDSFYFGYIKIEDVSTKKIFGFNLSVVYANGAALYESYDNFNDSAAVAEMLVKVFNSFSDL